MLTSLTLKNVRSWAEATIPLSPLTVIVGPNASGKTTILEALQFVARSTSVCLRWGSTSPGSPENLLREGSATLQIALNGELELTFSGGVADFSLVGTKPSAFTFRHQHGHADSLRSDGGNESLLEEFAALRLMRLESRSLAQSSYSASVIPRVQEDGSNLATVLAYLKQELPRQFDDIENNLKQIVPELEAIRAPRAEVLRDENRTVVIDGSATTLRETRSYIGNKLVFDMNGSHAVPASQAGEGTLLALGLLTSLREVNRPGVALLDDIDMRLHPRAQGELVKIIRRILSEGATRQFIGTTHSPFFLQHLKPEEVVVVESTSRGSVARRLDAHPEYAKWKNVMGVGEFWSWAGEAWAQQP